MGARISVHITQIWKCRGWLPLYWIFLPQFLLTPREDTLLPITSTQYSWVESWWLFIGILFVQISIHPLAPYTVCKFTILVLEWLSRKRKRTNWQLLISKVFVWLLQCKWLCNDAPKIRVIRNPLKKKKKKKSLYIEYQKFTLTNISRNIFYCRWDLKILSWHL